MIDTKAPQSDKDQSTRERRDMENALSISDRKQPRSQSIPNSPKMTIKGRLGKAFLLDIGLVMSFEELEILGEQKEEDLVDHLVVFECTCVQKVDPTLRDRIFLAVQNYLGTILGLGKPSESTFLSGNELTLAWGWCHTMRK
jgi:hypothetical protein